MTGLQHIVRDLMYAQENSAEPGSVSEDNYHEWQKIYTWHALVDQRYGQSFCNHFGISDNRLYYERDWVKCDSIIRSEWLARP
jgi:hypothetical protein